MIHHSHGTRKPPFYPPDLEFGVRRCPGAIASSSPGPAGRPMVGFGGLSSLHYVIDTAPPKPDRDRGRPPKLPSTSSHSSDQPDSFSAFQMSRALRSPRMDLAIKSAM